MTEPIRLVASGQYRVGAAAAAFEKLYCGDVFLLNVRTRHTRRVGPGTHPAWVDDHTLVIEHFRDGAPCGS